MREFRLGSRCCIATLALLATWPFFFSSCTALNEAQERRQEKIRQQQNQRYLTLARPDVQISLSPDGLEIGSDHYTLTFDDELLRTNKFNEPQERQDFARGALVYMEGLYEFIRQLFGVEPAVRRIRIVLYESFQGSTRLATTEYSYKTIRQGNEFLRTVSQIQMNFPMSMFDQREVRAHELTHAFTTMYYLPTWFTEGIAVFVQIEYAKGGDFGRIDLQKTMKLDMDNVNALQTWTGHTSVDAQWGYAYSYSVVKELYERFGEDFYPDLFRLIEEDELHQKLPGQMRTSMLVYYMSQAAGEDLVPFFNEVRFNVRRLTREEIVSIIRRSARTHQ